MNEEQRLENSLRNKVPKKFENDHDNKETDKSVAWAEENLGEKLNEPNEHKDSWWYFDLDAAHNKGMKPGDDVEKFRGPVYHYSETRDDDVEGTLKSTRW